MFKRLVVTGPAGSGKSTLAEAVAARIGVPFVELDAVFWGPAWTPTPRDAFRETVARLAAEEAWTIGASYGAVRDVLWARAEALVWLDLPLSQILGRLLRRTLRRIVRREELWSGNRETWRDAFFSRGSLFPYAIRQHRRFRRELPAAVAAPEAGHLQVWRLRSSASVADWLASLPAGGF
ncbi:MAG: AAA family ATPase [Anaerolineales bacterium]|nr:AAA family ATPase [Anaerolineales bacterium]